MDCSISEYLRLRQDCKKKTEASDWLAKMQTECLEEFSIVAHAGVQFYFSSVCDKGENPAKLLAALMDSDPDAYYTITGAMPSKSYVPYSIRRAPDMGPTTALEVGKTYRIRCSPTFRVLAIQTFCMNVSPCNTALKHWGHETGRWTLTEPQVKKGRTFYRLQNRITGRFLDVSEGVSDGAQVKARGRNDNRGGDAQLWSLQQFGERFSLLEWLGKLPKILDAERTQVQNEDCRVQVWTPPVVGSPTDNQLWWFYPLPDFAEMPGLGMGIRSPNGKFVAAHYEKEGDALADADNASNWTTHFRMIALTPYLVALLSETGRYVGQGNGGVLYVNAPNVTKTEKFAIDPPLRAKGIDVFPGQFKLRSPFTERYVRVDPQAGNRLIADALEPGATTFTAERVA